MNRINSLLALLSFLITANSVAEEPKKGSTKVLELGKDATLEVVYIPPEKFMMGSTATEKEWATGIKDVSYSDSRNGFRICLGVPRRTVAVELN